MLSIGGASSVIAITAFEARRKENDSVSQRPVLQVYVMRGCSACRRTERVLKHCERILKLMDVEIFELGADGVTAPPTVVGGPTTVFDGSVVALGTPDCTELAERLESLVAARR
jgi:hypothetical protein